jgi:hypothetical protein
LPASVTPAAESTLAGFETAIRLVDDIGAPATADNAVVAVTALEGLQRVADLHVRGDFSYKIVWKIEAPRLRVGRGEVKTNAP